MEKIMRLVLDDDVSFQITEDEAKSIESQLEDEDNLLRFKTTYGGSFIVKASSFSRMYETSIELFKAEQLEQIKTRQLYQAIHVEIQKLDTHFSGELN